MLFTNGSARIARDGAEWAPLPFAAGERGNFGSGSRVTAALEVDGRLLLAGDSDRMATFWLGEAPAD